MEDRILKLALANAVRYEGKANPGAVIGALIAEDPSVKKELKDISKKVQEVIKKISCMSVEEMRCKLQDLAPELLEKKECKRKEGLKELPNAEKGKVIMRFEPSPSGPLHIGHAFVLSLMHEYCKMYDGKLLLRIADTNASNIYTPAYDLIPNDARWLTDGNIQELVIQSDRMGIYYDHMLQLFEKEAAYVCKCPAEEFREYSKNRKGCPCRDNTKERNLNLWKQMFTTMEEGDAVVRLKTDMNHKNPAMRDFPLFRINDEEHPRTGKEYRVWPLMNFAVAIDDHTLGVTHSIRAKEHFDNEKRQCFIYDYFGWDKPTCLYVGRINFIDLRVSCSKTRPLIESGEYTGWDDIRLPFIPALKRRGYSPGAFVDFAKSVGVTRNDKTVSGEEFFKTMDCFDKQIRDDRTKRLFFIHDPVEITVKGAPEQELELDLHPDTMKKGRRFRTKDRFFITQEDHDAIMEMKDGHMIRLMDCLNLTKEGKQFIFHSKGYEEYMKAEHKKIIHWLPEGDAEEATVLMPDSREIKGLVERHDINKGEVIQFERFGYARKDEEGYFWFTHK